MTTARAGPRNLVAAQAIDPLGQAVERFAGLRPQAEPTAGIVSPDDGTRRVAG